MSYLETDFLKAWQEHGLPGIPSPKQQLQFCKERKFKLDFAFKSLKIGIELDGFSFGKRCPTCKQMKSGGHQTISGLTKSAEKQNLAIEYGWTLLRFTSSQLSSKQKRYDAVQQVNRVILNKGS